MADDAVNPTGTGEPLSIDDAVSRFFSEENPDEVNSEEDGADAPEPQEEDAPEPVDTEDNDDVPADVDDEPDDAEPDTYEVKVNGETKRVTIDELRSGYQRESDYRQKTAETAELKRRLETELSEQLQQQSQKFDELVPQLQSALTGKWQGVDWVRLSREDPAEYVRAKEEFESDQRLWNAAMQERQRVEEQTRAKAEADAKVRFDAEMEKLAQAIPDFKVPEKAAAKRDEYRELLTGFGFNEQDIAQIRDHRVIVLLDELSGYRKAAKQAEQAKAKASKAPPVAKPGAKTRTGKGDAVADARNRLKRSGSWEDAAALLIEEGLI